MAKNYQQKNPYGTVLHPETNAEQVLYDNSESGLPAKNVQEAIDKLAQGGGGSGGSAVQYTQMFVDADARPLTDPNRCKYNAETGYFEMNGLTDITLGEMKRIYFAGTIFLPYLTTIFSRYDYRTNYANDLQTLVRPAMQQQILANSTIEVLNMGIGVYYSTCLAAFQNLPNLTKVIGTIRMDYLNNATSVIFKDCPNLTYVELSKLPNSMKIFTGQTTKVTYECMKYLVDNLQTASAKTITTNSTTYSYLSGSATPTEQVGGTTEQWQQLTTDAQAKGFTFASE